MSKSAAVSLTSPSSSSASPGARPPTGLTNSVPLRSASHPLCPEPYVVSHHSSRRTDPTLSQRVYHPHRHTGVAAARRRHLHVGDNLHCVPLFARLGHLYLVPLPLVSAVGLPPGRAAKSASSTIAPPSAPLARSAPSPLPHRRHRLRDDRPMCRPTWHCSPNSLSNSPYSSICATAVPRNLSTSRYTSRAHTDSRRRPSPERASSYLDASPLSLRYRCARPSPIPSPRPGCSRLTANRNTRTVSQNRPNRVNTAILLMTCVESRRCPPFALPGPLSSGPSSH